MPGVTIGSHGMTHRQLNKLGDSELSPELSESRLRLEDITGKRIALISYPHGKVNRQSVQQIIEGSKVKENDVIYILQRYNELFTQQGRGYVMNE